MKLHEIKKSIRDGYARYRANQFQNNKKPMNFRDWQDMCADQIESNTALMAATITYPPTRIQ